MLLQPQSEHREQRLHRRLPSHSDTAKQHIRDWGAPSKTTWSDFSAGAGTPGPGHAGTHPGLGYLQRGSPHSPCATCPTFHHPHREDIYFPTKTGIYFPCATAHTHRPLPCHRPPQEGLPLPNPSPFQQLQTSITVYINYKQHIAYTNYKINYSLYLRPPSPAHDHLLVEAVVQHQAVGECQAVRLHGVPGSCNHSDRKGRVRGCSPGVPPPPPGPAPSPHRSGSCRHRGRRSRPRFSPWPPRAPRYVMAPLRHRAALCGTARPRGGAGPQSAPVNPQLAPSYIPVTSRVPPVTSHLPQTYPLVVRSCPHLLPVVSQLLPVNPTTAPQLPPVAPSSLPAAPQLPPDAPSYLPAAPRCLAAASSYSPVASQLLPVTPSCF